MAPATHPSPDTVAHVLMPGAQLERADARVLALVQELAQGPLPSWDPPPSALILNKAGFLW